MNTDGIARCQTLTRSGMDVSWQMIVHSLKTAWTHVHNIGRRSERRLRLAETLPLGERRFVAVIEFEETRFLLGGTANSMVLLARLDPGPSRRTTQPASAISVVPEEELF